MIGGLFEGKIEKKTYSPWLIHIFIYLSRFPGLMTELFFWASQNFRNPVPPMGKTQKVVKLKRSCGSQILQRRT